MRKWFKILSKIKYLRIKNWLLKLRRDGIRKRFLRELIPLILPKHHLARNGSGRRKREKPIEADYKKVDINQIAEKMGHESPLEDQISNDYRTSHLQGNFPGRNMGD